jgi:hypothetical protein
MKREPGNAMALAKAMQSFHETDEPEAEQRSISEAQKILESDASPDELLGECFHIMQERDPLQALASLQFLIAQYEFGENKGTAAVLMAIPMAGDISQMEGFVKSAPGDELTRILRSAGRIPAEGYIHWFPEALAQMGQANDWLLETRKTLIDCAMLGADLPAALKSSKSVPRADENMEIGGRLLVGCAMAKKVDVDNEASNPAILGVDAMSLLESPGAPQNSQADIALISLRSDRLDQERKALQELAEKGGFDSLAFGPAETLGLALMEAAVLHLQYLHGLEMQIHKLSESDIAGLYAGGELHIFGKSQGSSLMTGVTYYGKSYGPYHTLLPWKILHLSEFIEKIVGGGAIIDSEERINIYDDEGDFWRGFMRNSARNKPN